ncbi:MAG: fimbrillin family protein [Prevotella sp.]|jgi:hypothetical protein|nr:fimbrillin family protein [Prevotella sp.]
MITKRRNFVFRFLPGLFLSGLLLLSGCSQDDVSDVPAGSRAIGFRAQGGMSALKATTTIGDNIQSFVVNAHHSEESWADGNYMLQGTTVYRGEGGGNTWAYTPQAYFPTATAGTVEFFAYSPSVSANVVNGLKHAAQTGSTTQTVTYKVPVPDPKGTAVQEDFLVAYTNVAPDDYDETVKLQFRHALSRVLVAASSSLTEPVTITGLTLMNLKSEGTLQMKGGIASSVTWSSTGGPLVDYPYVLPASGVSVGKYAVDKSPDLVTSYEQGMFVLPQTTPGYLADSDTLPANTEFYLEVRYSVADAPARTFVQFRDPSVSSQGFTFESGKQYVLQLSFAAGSGGSSDPNINIGSAVSFSDIDAENYGKDIKVPVDYRASWARSNIYYNEMADGDPNNNEGALTFSETGDAEEGYQGVFFKWGSLVGFDAGATFTSSSYLFIPDLSTGKYKKVAVSNTATLGTLFPGWSGNGGGDDWILILAPDETVIDTSGAGRADARLTDRSTDADLYKDYKGDICKFLSDKKSDNLSGLTESWRMPISENFGPNNSYYTRSTDWPGSFTGTADEVVDGKAIMDFAEDKGFVRLTGFIFPGSTVPTFPNSGNRHSLGLNIGDSKYWSSSVYNELNAYLLNFSSSYLSPASSPYRDFGSSVRCVRSY